MELTYQGSNCVRLRGKSTQVLLDPPDPLSSVFAKMEPDIIVRTTGATDVDALRSEDGKAQIVAGPGEFEVRGVPVTGVAADGMTIMRVEVDDVRVVSLAGLHRELTEDEIEGLGHVDVLCIPVGGEHGITATAATKLARSVEPAIVVPLKAGEDEAVENFAKEMGVAEGWTAQPKLTLTGGMSASDETRVVILEARN